VKKVPHPLVVFKGEKKHPLIHNKMQGGGGGGGGLNIRKGKEKKKLVKKCLFGETRFQPAQGKEKIRTARGEKEGGDMTAHKGHQWKG